MASFEFKEEDGEDFEKFLKDHKDAPTFVDFNATWCGPCRALKPQLKKICEDNKFNFVSVDVDENPDLSENSMPKPYQIKELMESMNNYQRIFIVKDENGEITKIHTWKNPYPKMYFKDKEVSDKAISLILESDKKK